VSLGHIVSSPEGRRAIYLVRFDTTVSCERADYHAGIPRSTQATVGDLAPLDWQHCDRSHLSAHNQKAIDNKFSREARASRLIVSFGALA
jgi:hypothetical protein